MLALAIGRVAIEGGRRRGRSPSPLVAHQDPQPPGLCLASPGVEHRHRRVVRMQHGAGPSVTADRLGQRQQQEHGVANPVGQGGPVELDAGPGVDHALSVQREVVAIFGDQHMREQRRPWPATLDRQGWHRRLDDGLAGPAAHPRPDMADDLEAGRHVFEHLADVLAQHAEHRAAAARAGAGCGMAQRLARQVLGQPLPAAGPGGLRRWLAGRPDRDGSSPGRVSFLELADQQLELLDGPVELLRGAAEPRPAQHGQLGLELLDMQGLGVDLGVAGGDRPTPSAPAGPAGGRERPQRVGIGGQIWLASDMPSLLAVRSRPNHSHHKIRSRTDIRSWQHRRNRPPPIDRLNQ